jgi:O-antigen/teichoic acid export membrane protein
MVSDAPKPARPSLRLNALSNFGGLVVSVAIGFFLTPAMLGYLGERQFGIWTLASSLVGYFGLLECGVGGAVFRYVPLFRGQGNLGQVSAVISTSLAFYTILSLAIVALTLLLGQPLSRFFEGGTELAALLPIIGLALALSFPAIIFSTSASSYESFAPTNLVGIVTNALRGGLLFGCIWAGYGLVTMAWATLAVSAASLLGNFIVFRLVCKGARLKLGLVTWTELKMLLAFGIVIFVVGLANALATESPKQIVAKTISLDALGLFGVLLTLIGYYRMLIMSLTKVFSPRFSYLAGQEAEDDIRLLFTRGCRYMALIAGGVAVLMWITGPAFLLLWTGKPQVARMAPALAIMVAGTFVFLSHRLGGDLLFGLGRQGKVAILELTEAAGIVGLTIGLSLKFGVIGAAYGLAIPPLLVRGVLQTHFICRILKLSFVHYYSNCILAAWLVVGAMWGLAQFVDWSAIITGWVSLFAVSGLLLLLYSILSFVFVLNGEERDEVKQHLFRFFSWLGLPRTS